MESSLQGREMLLSTSILNFPTNYPGAAPTLGQICACPTPPVLPSFSAQHSQLLNKTLHGHFSGTSHSPWSTELPRPCRYLELLPCEGGRGCSGSHSTGTRINPHGIISSGLASAPAVPASLPEVQLPWRSSGLEEERFWHLFPPVLPVLSGVVGLLMPQQRQTPFSCISP